MKDERIEEIREEPDGGSAAEASGAAREGSRIKTEIYDWMQCIVSALLFCIILFVFFARIIGVVGHSMEPTLYDTDRVFISNLFYTPEQGDIVVFRKESFKDEPLVKRVIATEGQTVDIDFNRGVVIIDGVERDEPYTAALTTSRLDFNGPVTVPEGHIFVMGDNRNNSLDSRDKDISFIDTRCILGKVYFIVFPIGSFGSVYS